MVPKGFPNTVYNFAQNPLTEQGIALGRKLFYDGLLSKDGNFPCASCHQQVAAFGTFDHNLSHGINNSHTLRNAPPLQNLAWYSTFHADGGVLNLDVQPLSPITNPIEMGETLDGVMKKLSASATYRSMFNAAFGSETINTQRLSFALSQFMLTMVSANSKYDQVKDGKATFTLPESLGYDIFKQKCASCHVEPLFTDQSFRNAGFSIDSSNSDVGRMLITRKSSDSLKFKVPSLRNVLVSFPYAHDGRVVDLLTMLEHYNRGVVTSPTLDPQLRGGIVLSNFEKGQLVAFLGTLTDTAFLRNKALAQP
ncbi:MAG: cytochrome-c peroxidase [Bacteroidetes bacterium]|nr:MAG: cytochrome-c peroxidase [Bacteroidota bacterium]